MRAEGGQQGGPEQVGTEQLNHQKHELLAITSIIYHGAVETPTLIEARTMRRNTSARGTHTLGGVVGAGDLQLKLNILRFVASNRHSVGDQK